MFSKFSIRKSISRPNLSRLPAPSIHAPHPLYLCFRPRFHPSTPDSTPFIPGPPLSTLSNVAFSLFTYKHDLTSGLDNKPPSKILTLSYFFKSFLEKKMLWLNAMNCISGRKCKQSPSDQVKKNAYKYNDHLSQIWNLKTECSVWMLA